MRKFFALSLASLLCLGGPALASNCNVGSVEELHIALIESSPYAGIWAKGNITGTLEYEFKSNEDGVAFIKFRYKYAYTEDGWVFEDEFPITYLDTSNFDYTDGFFIHSLAVSPNCHLDGSANIGPNMISAEPAI